jgi:hypothetical protein
VVDALLVVGELRCRLVLKPGSLQSINGLMHT